jgi:nicotinamidase-related amidase
MNTALLIIDVHVALTSGEFAAFEADCVIARINEVSAKARKAEAPVVFIQHESTGGPLNRGSDGWRLADGLVVEPTDLRVSKTATKSFHHTNLQLELQARGVDRLVICGFQSECCVDTTTRRALALGYSITLVSDGHSTIDSPRLTAAQIARTTTTRCPTSPASGLGNGGRCCGHSYDIRAELQRHPQLIQASWKQAELAPGCVKR